MDELSLTIRKAQLSDVEALTSITRELNWFQPHSVEINASKLKSNIAHRFYQHIEQSIVSHFYSLYVADVLSNGIVGYSAVYWLNQLYLPAAEGFITDLFVSSPFQRQGIASLLLEQIKDEAIARDCSRLMLQANKNKPVYLNEFYIKRGWEECQTTAVFIYKLKNTN